MSVFCVFGMGMEKLNMLETYQSNLWDVRIIPTKIQKVWVSQPSNPSHVFSPFPFCFACAPNHN